MTLHRIARALVVLGALLALGCGCTSTACAPERLPHAGRVATPEAMFELAQYAAREDCCEVLHGLLSPATRQKHGETIFCLWWDSESLKLPAPYEYTVAEILRGGVCRGPLEYEGRRFVYVEYRDLLLQLLWVLERTADGREEARLALTEQFEPDPPARPVPWNAGE